jgi:hypothetical protein
MLGVGIISSPSAWEPDSGAARTSNPGWYRAGEIAPYGLAAPASRDATSFSPNEPSTHDWRVAPHDAYRYRAQRSHTGHQPPSGFQPEIQDWNYAEDTYWWPADSAPSNGHWQPPVESGYRFRGDDEPRNPTFPRRMTGSPAGGYRFREDPRLESQSRAGSPDGRYRFRPLD